MTEQTVVVKEERNKTIVIIALFCSILLPPIGLILGLIELFRASKNNTLRALAIVAILMSLVTAFFYVHTYMDNDSFDHKIHHTQAIN